MTGSETRDLVRRRAGDRCEYCLLRQEHSHLTHHVEHIVANQHGGSDELVNLALPPHQYTLRIEGTTPTGRGTVHVLAMNDTRRLDLRQELLVRGNFP